MTKTLTTETIKLWRINAEITLGETDELDPENNAAKAILALTAELLRYREAAENPSCWEIAGQLFTTKEDALKPGYVGTPEPLYDGPVLTDGREAQPVAYLKKSIIDSERFDSVDPEIILPPNTPEGWHSEYQAVLTATPAPAYPEILPCAVRLMPGVIFGEGVRTSIMLDGLRRREEHNAEMAAMTPEQKDEQSAAIKALFSRMTPPAPAVVKLPTEFYSDEGVVVRLEEVMAALALVGVKYERNGNACRAAMLAQPVSQGKLPEGFKLMPIEITDEIAEAIAMEARCCGGIALCIYEAALAAAPEGGNEK